MLIPMKGRMPVSISIEENGSWVISKQNLEKREENNPNNGNNGNSGDTNQGISNEETTNPTTTDPFNNLPAYTIPSATILASPSSSAGSDSTDNNTNEVSKGAMYGIIFGSIFGVALIICALLTFNILSQKKRKEAIRAVATRARSQRSRTHSHTHTRTRTGTRTRTRTRDRANSAASTANLALLDESLTSQSTQTSPQSNNLNPLSSPQGISSLLSRYAASQASNSRTMIIDDELSPPPPYTTFAAASEITLPERSYLRDSRQLNPDDDLDENDTADSSSSSSPPPPHSSDPQAEPLNSNQRHSFFSSNRLSGTHRHSSVRFITNIAREVTSTIAANLGASSSHDDNLNSSSIPSRRSSRHVPRSESTRSRASVIHASRRLAEEEENADGLEISEYAHDPLNRVHNLNNLPEEVQSQTDNTELNNLEHNSSTNFSNTSPETASNDIELVQNLNSLKSLNTNSAIKRNNTTNIASINTHSVGSFNRPHSMIESNVDLSQIQPLTPTIPIASALPLNSLTTQSSENDNNHTDISNIINNNASNGVNNNETIKEEGDADNTTNSS